MSDIKRLAGCISCHAWNSDGTKLALSPNTNEIHIYSKSGTNYNLDHVLKEHDQVVTGIDWAPKSNRIVTCSHDRNAYVWTFKDNQWKPVLVILRINRCATHVKWSPEENKFAVASGAKCISVCYFEEDHDWWVSKNIKKHRSTVLKLDWHPNNALIATASSDFKCRIFAAHIKGVDTKTPKTPFGEKFPFGECFAEIDTAFGWVQSVRWSPSGNLVAFVGHDSTLSVADISSGTAQTQTIKYRELPFRDLVFIDEKNIVAVGHDCSPVLFSNTGTWGFTKVIDSGGSSKDPQQKGSSAFKTFQAKVDKGETTTETILNTKHQNCITWVGMVPNGGGKYSTSGLDGNLIIWNKP